MVGGAVGVVRMEIDRPTLARLDAETRLGLTPAEARGRIDCPCATLSADCDRSPLRKPGLPTFLDICEIHQDGSDAIAGFSVAGSERVAPHQSGWLFYSSVRMTELNVRGATSYSGTHVPDLA